MQNSQQVDRRKKKRWKKHSRKNLERINTAKKFHMAMSNKGSKPIGGHVISLNKKRGRRVVTRAEAQGVKVLTKHEEKSHARIMEMTDL